MKNYLAFIVNSATVEKPRCSLKSWGLKALRNFPKATQWYYLRRLEYKCSLCFCTMLPMCSCGFSSRFIIPWTQRPKFPTGIFPYEGISIYVPLFQLFEITCSSILFIKYLESVPPKAPFTHLSPTFTLTFENFVRNTHTHIYTHLHRGSTSSDFVIL